MIATLAVLAGKLVVAYLLWAILSKRGLVGRALEWLIVTKLAAWFPERYRLIPRVDDGRPLLRQFKLTSWLYLQSFAGPETTALFHVHRWRRMFSMVLSGRLVEERYPGFLYVVHEAPHFYTMGDTDIHRIEHVEPRTWTLFAMFGKNEQPAVHGSSWGYYPRPAGNCGYVPFDKQIPSRFRVRPL